ncbi:MAG: ABC transporter ATP-binding protein [Armatimonadota bacterium]
MQALVSVSLEGVTKLFGETAAVDRVTLELRGGELFFLLGPSGCGKTTCLRIVAGFYEPDTGTVRFDEREMNRVPPHLRNTGMVFQNYALWPHMTVADNVEYGLRLRKLATAERTQKVDRALEVVRMTVHAGKHPNQLSGGQQQRIALARALVIEPDVLLLDEPLSNLDAKLRGQMRYEIKRIHAEVGTTALYVTHDQVEALSMADRLAVMHEGRIEQVGTPREIYNAPVNRFVAQFIGDTNFVDGTVTAEPSDGRVVVDTNLGELTCSAPTDGVAAGASITCSMRPESLTIHLRSPENPNEFPARIGGLTYLGDTEEYELLAADDLVLRAVMLNPGTDAPQVGSDVAVSAAPEDIAVLLR